MSFDWSDLRVFVAVLEHGSTRRAAKALCIEQTTCARRVAALEAGLGLPLFDKGPAGYTPTPAALALRAGAVAVARGVAQFEQAVERERRSQTRTIRVTAEEPLASWIAIPAVSRFSAAHPHIKVEIDVSRDLRDLTAGEADIALRAGPEPTEPSLIRRKLADDPWGLYCSEAYAAGRTPPGSAQEVPGHPLVCFDRVLPLAEAAGLGPHVRQVVNTVGAVQSVIEGGACVGALPRSMGDRASGLKLCFPLPFPAAHWLVYPERLRGRPDMRVLAELIVAVYRERGLQRPGSDGTGRVDPRAPLA